MGIKENFLREIKIGNRVELMIGAKEMTGIVVSVDLDAVRIRRANGKEPVLSLDSISYYEIVEESFSELGDASGNSDIRDKAINSKMIDLETTIDISVPEIMNINQPLSNVPFHFHAIETRGLVFETCFWNDDVNHIAITPPIKEKVKQADSTNTLLNELSSICNKICYCAKINEFQLKYGRIQPIIQAINRLCEKYNDDFLYELLSIILIRMEATYKEAFNKVNTNRVVRLSDAVVCYNKRRFDEMAYYSSEFYSNVKLTEQNFDNYLFVVPYLIKNGYGYIIVSKYAEVEKLSESRRNSFAFVYNAAKFSPMYNAGQYVPSKAGDDFTDVKPTNNSVVSKIMAEEIKMKTEKLVRNGNFTQAYNMVEKKFKENPEDEALSELLQYVGRVKSNALKFKNLPSDGSFYAKALRDWHIYEDVNSAKKNFVLSIDNREKRYFSAIMDYVDLIMHTDGEKIAVETLMSYKDTIRTLDPDSRIKYFEKLSSLYLKGKNYENLLNCLNSLKELYTTKVRRANNRGLKEKGQLKVGGIIFRISQCQYGQGKYQQSISTCKEAIDNGHNLNACVNQMVFCYVSLNDFEAARDIVREYTAKDYNLMGLFEKIDTLEEAFNRKSATGDEGSEPVDIYTLLGFDNEFINYYESNCGFEGISEERKISGNYTEDDLGKIENEIKYASRTKPKDRADYYLTAACIEKTLNDKSDKYYGFIANSMLYHGHLLLANRDFDSAKSYYLTAISLSLSSTNGARIERDAICNYLYCTLKSPKTQTTGESIKFESEIMLLIPKINEIIKDDEIVYDIINLLKTSKRMKEFFEKNSNQSICTQLIDEVKKNVGCEQNGEQLWFSLDEKYKNAESEFNKWYSAVQLDKNFDHEMENEVLDVKKGLLVTRLDVEYITRYINCCKTIREYREYSDFDNRIRFLNQGINEIEDLISMGHKNSTLFFENYLLRVIRVTKENLESIITRTSEDYKPELEFDVPITNIPVDNGHVSLSVTISNADNKATARNISLLVLSLDGKELYKKGVSNSNLRGGSSISELIKIPVGEEEAFTVNIVLRYEDDENKEYSYDKPISISTKAENFELIRNPYITGKPVVSDEMFFGRDAMVQRLVDAIEDDRIRCIIIYGQKRTGKSSIFDHLKRKLVDNFIVLNFSVGADITSEKNFYKSVQNEFVAYLEDNDYDTDIIDTFENFQISDFIDFEKYIGKANRAVSKPANKEILLMIDEFTHIYTYIKDASYDIGENFMDKWKAMIEKNLFKSALIGQDFMPDFIREYANQFQVTDPIYVSYLERKDAIDLVTVPIAMKDGSSRFLEGSEELIVDWFNGQPYYLQSYCSKLVNYINGEQRQNHITTAIAKKVMDAMLSSVQLDFFDNLVRIDEIDMLEVLLKIAQSSDTLGTKIRIDRLQLNAKQMNALERLATRGVVDYIKAEQRCGITIPFFHEWLRKSY